jgi:membrane fusion protein, multidrug efflux system
MRIALAVAAVLLAACGERELPVRGSEPVPELRTATVELRDVDVAISAEAAVEAVRQSTVSSQVAGRIVDIRFDVGDRVEKGSVIVRIDERAATQAVAASEAQVRAAEATLAQARADLERSRKLRGQNFISQAAYDKAETDFKAAEQQMKVTLAGAGQAATERSFATIVAPYSGVVATRHVELGEMATPGKPLMTGFDPASLRVVANVPSSEVAALRGARARVEIPSAARWLDARAVTVLPAADPRTHSTQVRVELPEDVRGIYPGVFARVHFVVGRVPRLMVPAEAVVRRSELTAVYVIGGDGRPRLRQVRLGSISDEHGIEVLAGVRAGERVALEGAKAGMLAFQDAAAPDR